jgi:hypothetical protein
VIVLSWKPIEGEQPSHLRIVPGPSKILMRDTQDHDFWSISDAGQLRSINLGAGSQLWLRPGDAQRVQWLGQAAEPRLWLVLLLLRTCLRRRYAGQIHPIGRVHATWKKSTAWSNRQPRPASHGPSMGLINGLVVRLG